MLCEGLGAQVVFLETQVCLIDCVEGGIRRKRIDQVESAE